MHYRAQNPEFLKTRFDPCLRMCDIEFYGGKTFVGLDGTGLKKFGGTQDGTGRERGARRLPVGRAGTDFCCPAGLWYKPNTHMNMHPNMSINLL